MIWEGVAIFVLGVFLIYGIIPEMIQKSKEPRLQLPPHLEKKAEGFVFVFIWISLIGLSLFVWYLIYRFIKGYF